MPKKPEPKSFAPYVSTRSEIEQEFRELAETENPPLPENAKFIWVLSSRHTVKLAHLNCAEQSINFTPLPTSDKSSTEKSFTEEKCDVEDDFIRLKTAIEIAKDLAAKRAGVPIEKLTKRDYQKYAPTIIYNGWPKQNEDLRDMLNKETRRLPYYPMDKFVIFDLPTQKDLRNTVGQFICLQDRILQDKKLAPLKKVDEPLVILTSGYHAPRVRGIFGSPYHGFPLIDRQQITFHLIDRQAQRPCAARDIQGEIQRIMEYNEKGWLGKPKEVNCKGARIAKAPVVAATDKSATAWTPFLQTVISKRARGTRLNAKYPINSVSETVKPATNKPKPKN